jgi:glycosyltransferase involved in cell wall biosynthesis
MIDLVSVIVPVYNHAQYLEQCLDSIYNDDYPNIELIIIDDGSKDESIEVIQNWRAVHPDRFHKFYLEKQENLGVCKTLNKLVSLSQGKYICPLASDDYLLVGGIQDRVNTLHNNPGWLLVFGDQIIVDEDNNLINDSGILLFHGNKAILSNRKFIEREIILCWSIAGATCLIKKDAFNPEIGVGLYPENSCVEDVDFYYRLLARQAVGFVDSKVLGYRIVSNSASHHPLTKINLLKDWQNAASKNSTNFQGLNRLCLKLLSYRLKLVFNKITVPSLKNKLIYLPFAVFFKLICLLHRLDFYVYSLSRLPKMDDKLSINSKE